MQKSSLRKKKILVILTILFALLIGYSQFVTIGTTQAAGTITGRVFQDFNGNGKYDTTSTFTTDSFGAIRTPIDRGISNVQVRAYDSEGTNVTTGGYVNTDISGNYTITTNDAGSGPYRIEFTNLPSGYFPAARSIDSATNSDPSVRFASTPANNVNLTLNYPADYSQNNAETAPVYALDDQSTAINNSFPNSDGNDIESPATFNNEAVANVNPLTFNRTVDSVLPPTSIRLNNFEAFSDGNNVSLRWSTDAEPGNLGFNVYREAGGKRELLNAALIAGSALRSNAELQAGESYNWNDAEPKSGAAYYLEDIDIDGTTTLHGPISPQFKIFVNRYEQQSALLSDLTKVEMPSAETEFVRETNSANPVDQMSQWQVAGQIGVKIIVNHDGWYRVSAQQLQSASFDTASNEANWQLFAGAAEVPMKIGRDGSIEFFGRGVDTAVTDKQVYYLVYGQSAGARVGEIKGGSLDQNPAQNYAMTVQRKDRSLYISSILNGDAENWFGAIVNSSNQTTQTLTVNKLDPTGQARLQVKLQGLTAGGHVVNVRFNNFDLGTVSFSDHQNRQFEFNLPASSVVEGVNTVTYRSVGASSDVSITDTVSLRFPRRYEASNDKIRFSVPAGQTAKVSGFSTGKITIYEIQNGQAARQMAVDLQTMDGGYGFGLGVALYDREFIALANMLPEQPVNVEQNAPSNWNDSTNRADFIIIAPASLQAQAANLAGIRQNQGLQTRVVLAEDIGDEFGSGILTSDAVKQFLQTAATTWQLKPKYVLLFGDSTYDVRNYLGLTNRNLVPTRLIDTMNMETSSDGWLADFDGDGVENISIGRLPAANEAEASQMVAKLVRYDNQPTREKSNVIVADRYFEIYSNSLEAEMPSSVQKVRIHRVNMTDAAMRAAILSNLNNGPMIATYIGHGSTGVWSGTSIFSYSDAANLTNSQLSVYLLMTCLNAYTHGATGDSLAEAALKADNGAVAVWSSSAVILAEPTYAVTKNMTRIIFKPSGNVRIGDIMRQAKPYSTDSDVKRTWQLIGDPTIYVK